MTFKTDKIKITSELKSVWITISTKNKSTISNNVYILLLASSLLTKIPSDFLLPLMITSLVALTDLLPISVAGMGTREATLIAIFSLYLLAPEQAVSFSILYFIVFYLFMIIFSYPFFALSSDKIKF